MSKPKNAALNIFIPLSKVNVEQRLVYGTVAEEVLDNSGEVFDYDSSKPNFEKWSAQAEEASGGLSKGNLRSMHGSTAAGKLTELGFDDDAKRIECCAKVVDDNEWKKVLEGVYTGFSMGGRYERKWDMKKGEGVTEKRYTALPVEVSLVDKPCIPTATFDGLVKFERADGSIEELPLGKAYNEDQPRDENGRWGEGSGGGSGGGGESGGSGDDDDGNDDDDRDLPPPSEVLGWMGGTVSTNKDGSYTVTSKNFRGEETSRQVSAVQYKHAALQQRSEQAFKENDKLKTPESLAASQKADARLKLHFAANRGEITKKFDTGESNMYVPTNDETLPVARELAKAAGSEGAWPDFMDAARDHLTKAFAAKKGAEEKEKPPVEEEDDDKAKEQGKSTPAPEGESGGDNDAGDAEGDGSNKGDVLDGEEREKAIANGEGADGGQDDGEKDEKDDEEDEDEGDNSSKAAKKGDLVEGDEVVQGWSAKDGTFFLKKGDAIAHNKASERPTLADQIRGLRKSLNGPEDPETVQEMNKYADFYGNEVLAKGLYEVSRMSDLLRSAASLTLCVQREAKEEGDGSSLPADLEKIVSTIGDTLIAMAKEETAELIASVAKNAERLNESGVVESYIEYSDPYMSLASSTLGLEKAELEKIGNDVLAKRAPAEPAGGEVLSKAELSDQLAKLSGELAEHKDLLAKRDAEIAEAMPLLKTLQEDIERLKAMPLPEVPRGDFRALSKSEDVSGLGGQEPVNGLDLTKLTPSQLADAAIRLSHSRPMHLSTAPQG